MAIIKESDLDIEDESWKAEMQRGCEGPSRCAEKFGLDSLSSGSFWCMSPQSSLNW